MRVRRGGGVRGVRVAVRAALELVVVRTGYIRHFGYASKIGGCGWQWRV